MLVLLSYSIRGLLDVYLMLMNLTLFYIQLKRHGLTTDRTVNLYDNIQVIVVGDFLL